VSVVVLAITIVAAAQLVVAARLAGRAAVRDAVSEVAADADAIERRAATGGTVAEQVARAGEALATVRALPGVHAATLSTAGNATGLDATGRAALGEGRAVAADGPAADGSIRVVAPVTVAGTGRVLDVRVDPTPAARSALASWLATAGLVALVGAALAGLVLLVARRRHLARHRLALLAAFTDDLTGLPNRRAFVRRLVVAVRQARDHDAPLTLALFDVTGLGDVNTSAGRRRGDELLAEVGQVLAEVGRAGAGSFRLGSSSFALLLPATDGDQAIAVTRELRTRIETVARPLGGIVGLCVLDADLPDADSLLAGAEGALRDARAAEPMPAPVQPPQAVQVPEPRVTRPPVARVAAAYTADGVTGAEEPGLGQRDGEDPWDIRWITGWN
jgi:diguanylate cyclase (GGDEF)-like protein